MKFARKRKLINARRTNSAFSLVTVLCSGLIGAMWIGASYSMLIPLMQQSSAGKQSNMMRNLAESAIDYVAKDISVSAETSQVSQYDDPDVGAPYKTFELTPMQLGIEDASNKNVRLALTVKNEYPISEQESAMFDYQSVPNIDSKKQWSMVTAQSAGWRTIEVRVGLGSTSSTKSIYRAHLRPEFGEILYSSSSSSDPKLPYFPGNDAAFGTTSINVGSNTVITGNLSTNGSRIGSAPLSITGSGISLTGNVTVNSLSKASNDLVALGSDTQTGTQPKIKGYVNSNGDSTGFYNANDTTADPTGRIAVETPSPSDPTYNGPEPINTKLVSDQISVAPAPSAPSDATDLGSIGLSGSAKLVIRDGPVDIPSGQTLSNLNSGTAYIPPGNYKVSSLDVTGNSSIQVSDAAGLSQPASFFVDNSTTGTSAVNIGGNGVVNNTAGNLQVWYNGSSNINVSGVQTSMSLYAPNASINIAGSNSIPAKFTGAMLGSNVNISNANLIFEQPSAKTKNSSGPMMFSTSADGGKNVIKPKRLKRVLWQELTYSEYIKQGNLPF